MASCSTSTPPHDQSESSIIDLVKHQMDGKDLADAVVGEMNMDCSDSKLISITPNAPFSHFVNILRSCVGAPVVVEFGCGSGIPLAAALYGSLQGENISMFEANGKVHLRRAVKKLDARKQSKSFQYRGIDVSHRQIQLAHSIFDSILQSSIEGVSLSFDVGEMAEECKTAPRNSVDAVIILFALFHIPRHMHCELLHHVNRMLRPGGVVYFNACIDGFEGSVSDSWLDKSLCMYWSSFSASWYRVTLKELGMECEYAAPHTVVFDGCAETMEYLVFKKPNVST